MTSNNSESDIKLEPPEIPQFVDNLRIREITPEIETRLALLLDLPSVGDSLRNWEWLAFSLGMPWEKIKVCFNQDYYVNFQLYSCCSKDNVL